MIIVHIDPEGVRKVFIDAESEQRQDQDLVVWPLIRQDLNRLNRRLERFVDNHKQSPPRS